jgi:hypothetical protein
MRNLGWTPNVSLEDHIREYKSACTREAKTEKRILVFSTTFFPIEGPAEKALFALMQEMKDVQFDVITSMVDRSHENTSCALSNVTIHRVGRGNRWDKYRLILDGYRKAKELSASHRYLFSWSIMASYAALAAALFRRANDLPLLITLADQRLDEIPLLMKWVIRFILRNADQISTSTAHQERGVSRIDPAISLTTSNRSGDAFANQIRFLYNSLINKN